MPSTTSATIIMVAKTGRLMLASDRNMSVSAWLCCVVASALLPGRRRRRRCRLRASAVRAACLLPPARARTFALAHDRRLHAVAHGADVARDHAVARRQPVDHLGHAARLVDD